MRGSGLKPGARRADGRPMPSVELQLISIQLASARQALDGAAAVSVQTGGTEVQAEVILSLSAEAQQLLTLKFDDAA